MSHDRGCPCGRDRGEYDDCKKSDCIRRDRGKMVMPKSDKPKLKGPPIVIVTEGDYMKTSDVKRIIEQVTGQEVTILK